MKTYKDRDICERCHGNAFPVHQGVDGPYWACGHSEMLWASIEDLRAMKPVEAVVFKSMDAERAYARDRPEDDCVWSVVTDGVTWGVRFEPDRRSRPQDWPHIAIHESEDAARASFAESIDYYDACSHLARRQPVA